MEDDDFWLLLDTNISSSSISINSGKDNDGGSYYGGVIDLAITDNYQFNLAGSRQKAKEETSRWSWGIGNNPQNNFTWNLAYEWWGDSDIFETHDLNINLNYFNKSWTWIFGIEKGDFELHGLLAATKVDHRAYELGIGKTNNNLYWKISHQIHDYGLDPGRLNFPQILFFLNPRLLYIVTPKSQQQASVLADYESVLQLGWAGEEYRFETNYQIIKSAVTKEIDNIIGLSVSKQLTVFLNITIEFTRVMEIGTTGAGIEMIYSW